MTASSACSERRRGSRKAREVAAPPQLGDLQLDRPRARLPLARPIAVAMRHPILRTALTELRAHQLADLALHQLGAHHLERRAQHVAVLAHHHLPDDLLDRHPVGTGHAAPPFIDSVERADDHRRRVGRNHVPSERLLHQP
jgi:hypothetical protein